VPLSTLTWLERVNLNRRASNRLLAALPTSSLRKVLDACEIVELAFAEVLYTPGQRLLHVYFPLTAFISLVMPIDRSASLEVVLIGSEGMFGIPLVLGVKASPVRAMVQGAGSALRMPAEVFARTLESNPEMQREIYRYIVVHVSQLERAAGCTRFHVVDARLARWLLMMQDRAHASTFHVTQAFLALMLGVRRVGITTAAGTLQRRGFIEYTRGSMTVLDRRGLKTASCGCYQADCESYDRILGPPRARGA